VKPYVVAIRVFFVAIAYPALFVWVYVETKEVLARNPEVAPTIIFAYVVVATVSLWCAVGVQWLSARISDEDFMDFLHEGAAFLTFFVLALVLSLNVLSSFCGTCSSATPSFL
jgi:hypothetical protein